MQRSIRFAPAIPAAALPRARNRWLQDCRWRTRQRLSNGWRDPIRRSLRRVPAIGGLKYFRIDGCCFWPRLHESGDRYAPEQSATIFSGNPVRCCSLGRRQCSPGCIDQNVDEEGETLMSIKKFQTLALTAIILAGSLGLAFAQNTSDHGDRIGPRGPASGSSGAGVSTSRTGKAAGGGG
jgi:hypothetical protein